MSNDNHIKHFTAADIEKYHQDKLSAGERHELEKAALEDPFLADALEGYGATSVNIPDDLAELRKRLEQRTGQAKVIPIGGTGSSSFRWLRAAVVIGFIAGAGLLVYQLGFRQRSANIAEVKKNAPVKETAGQADSAVKIVPGNENPAPGTTNTATVNGNGSAQTLNQAKEQSEQVTVTSKGNVAGNPAPGRNLNDGNAAAPVVPPAPVVAAENIRDEAKDMKQDVARADAKKEVIAAEEKAKLARKENNNVAVGITNAPARQENDWSSNNRGLNNNARRAVNNNNQNNQAFNVFRGRVTDQQNNGVPFARVFNPNDSDAGTYTDAMGNFNLTYPDSILTVEVKALGFENANVQLSNNAATSSVVMQDDRSLSEVVISNRKPNAAARSRANNQTVEEPEPADGWDNYDSYLANNLQLPDEYLKKQTGGEVQVSFEVDRNGEPIAIRIEKSLCKSCDQEAIRLIKEGPKWRRKARHGRTTVTITF